MSVCQFIHRLLNIKAFSVKDYTFRNWFTELWLEVKPYKNGALCPQCIRRGKIIRTVDPPRIWRDLPVCGRQVFFTYSPREIICRTHVCKNSFHGQPLIPVSLIALNILYLFTVQP